MVGNFDITLLGAPELQRMLNDMTDKLERKVLTQAFRKAARTVQQDAIRRAPVRKVTGSGKVTKRRTAAIARHAEGFARLRNSFKVRALKRRKRRLGYAVWTGTRAQLGIAGKYYYPAHVELGHGPPHRAGRAGTARRSRGGHAPKHPYLRPALIQNNAGLLALLETEIRSGIERHAGDTPGSQGSGQSD